MKILITGMSRKQCVADEDTPRSRYYLQSPKITKKIFEKLGHKVDWRPVTPGENIDSYDRVIVFLSKFDEKYTNSALWAISQRPDAVFSADDWQITGHLGEYKNTARKIEEGIFNYKNTSRSILRDDKFGPKKFRKEALIYQDQIEEAVIILAKPWKRSMINLFPWGDFDKMKLNCERVCLYDPSNVCQEFSSINDSDIIPENRSKTIISASISKDPTSFVKKLKIEDMNNWERKYYGKAPKIEGCEPIKGKDEAFVCGEYLNNRALLSLPYGRTAGSGWWRVRYIHAAYFKNIIIQSKEDSENMGQAFKLHDKIELLNEANNEQLDMIANAQSEWLKNNFTKEEDLYYIIDRDIIQDEMKQCI